MKTVREGRAGREGGYPFNLPKIYRSLIYRKSLLSNCTSFCPINLSVTNFQERTGKAIILSLSGTTMERHLKESEIFRCKNNVQIFVCKFPRYEKRLAGFILYYVLHFYPFHARQKSSMFLCCRRVTIPSPCST